MPNIKSAKKRVLINEKKNLQNRMALSTMKTAIRKVNEAIATNNIDLADSLLPSTFSIIDKTASKGIIHVNKAANQKSALAKKLHAIRTGKLVITIKKTNQQVAAEKAKAANEARAVLKAEQAKRKAAKEEAAKEKAKEDKTKKKVKVETKEDKKATKADKKDDKKVETKTKVDTKEEKKAVKVDKKEDKKTETKAKVESKENKKAETKQEKDTKKDTKATKEEKPKKEDKKK
ncbi:MAG: 30S ribosomal protein S20 [Firmicutes bacterium]|nr:30S ribosomal protein S20 [Bacillota bacterium]MCL1953209.1 30S ribosomal protein S20 [Bacillota bacterium]